MRVAVTISLVCLFSCCIKAQEQVQLLLLRKSSCLEVYKTDSIRILIKNKNQFLVEGYIALEYWRGNSWHEYDNRVFVNTDKQQYIRVNANSQNTFSSSTTNLDLKNLKSKFQDYKFRLVFHYINPNKKTVLTYQNRKIVSALYDSCHSSNFTFCTLNE